MIYHNSQSNIVNQCDSGVHCSVPGTIPLLDEGDRLLGTEDGRCLLLGQRNGPSDPLTLLEDLEFETREINQLKVGTIFCRVDVS